MVRSSDDGETWHTVVTPDPGGGNGATGCQISDGTIFVNATHWRWVPIDRKDELVGHPSIMRERPELGIAGVATGAFITRSTNDGYNWDAPRVVPTEGVDVSVSHGPVTELDDGSLLVPLEGVAPGANEKKVWVNRSTDGGETWEFHGTVADPKEEFGFMELRLLRLPSGRLLATMRTQEANFFQAHSDDDGATWSPNRDTGIWCHGSSPLDMMLLEDGRVLCSYAQRREPFGIYACILTDEGETWHNDKQITQRDDGVDRDMGYPNSVQMDDGSILTVYYWHEKGQTRRLEWIRWTLEQ